MKVRLAKQDMGVPPKATGHKAKVAYGPGQTGTIVRFIQRRVQGYEFYMAVVKWDAQKWREWDTPLNRMKEGQVYSGDDINRLQPEGAEVALGSFEWPAHLENLAPVEVSESAKRPTAKPRRETCTHGFTRVPGEYIVNVRTQFSLDDVIADLQKTHGIKVKSVWGAISGFSALMTDKQLAGLMEDGRLASVGDNCR